MRTSPRKRKARVRNRTGKWNIAAKKHVTIQLRRDIPLLPEEGSTPRPKNCELNSYKSTEDTNQFCEFCAFLWLFLFCLTRIRPTRNRTDIERSLDMKRLSALLALALMPVFAAGCTNTGDPAKKVDS